MGKYTVMRSIRMTPEQEAGLEQVVARTRWRRPTEKFDFSDALREAIDAYLWARRDMAAGSSDAS